MLDLLKLHVPDEDMKPQSWICARGDNLLPITLDITEEIKYQTKQNLWDLSRIISKKLGCHPTTVYRPLRNKKKFIPLCMISEIIEIWRKKCGKNNSDVLKLRKQIIQGIEYLKVNNSACSERRAVKEITPDLAKLLGAHAADGSLPFCITFFSKNKQYLKILKNRLPKDLFLGKIYDEKERSLMGINVNSEQNKKLKEFLKKEVLIKANKVMIKHGYRVKIVDSQKNAIKAYQIWLKNCFEKETKNKKLKNCRAYGVNFKDKIIARYFNLFFEFPYGKKSRRVSEPILIKNSSIEIRKNFIIGLMTFDGSVNNRTTIGYTSVSKKLRDDLLDFFRKKGFRPKHFSDNLNPKRYILRIYPKKEMEIFELSEYFVERTPKWFRLIDICVVQIT